MDSYSQALSLIESSQFTGRPPSTWMLDSLSLDTMFRVLSGDLESNRDIRSFCACFLLASSSDMVMDCIDWGLSPQPRPES